MEDADHALNDTDMSAIENPPQPVKKRGRPPKKARETTAQSEEASPNEENTADEAPKPKKRGRKPKSAQAAVAANKESSNEATSPEPLSEKRRRPSAYSYAEYSDASDGSENDEAHPVTESMKSPNTTSTSGKRRGRPPKAHKKVASSKPYTPGKRGRPPKSWVEAHKGEKAYDSDYKGNDTTSKKQQNEGSNGVTGEKRRRGRPRKVEKVEDGGKWSDGSTSHKQFALPLPVPESWPMVSSMDEILTELTEMYNNVKEEKRAEFHNQIKAFVFALQWEDGSFSAS